MQRPLNANRLRALVEHRLDNDGLEVISAKRYFEKQNLSEGLFNLFAAFQFLQTRLRILSKYWEDQNRGPDNWLVYFRNRPFTQLNVRPDPHRQAFVKIYEDDTYIQAYEILGHPEQWQAMVQWFWNYGNDRLVRQAAIEARKVSRSHQVSSNLSRSNPSRNDPTRKRLLDFARNRPSHSKHFKAQALKSRGKIKPSNLRIVTLADIEQGDAGEAQTLQEEDSNRQIAIVSSTKFSADIITSLEDTGDDVHKAGA